MIQYTSRTFSTVMQDFNADPTLVDKPAWIKQAFAGIMDVISNVENLSANQAFLRTALTKQAVLDNAQLIDYYPAGRITSSGTLFFDIKPTTGLPYTVAQADLAAVYPGTVGVSSKRFEARSTLVFNSSTEVTPAANWNTGTSQVTVANAYTTGEKFQLSTSGSLPAGFSLNTDYFAILVDPTHIKIASTRANAFAGAFITLTTQGSGNHTLTRLSRSVAAFQQTSVLNSPIGAGDGVTAWQEFRIPQIGVLNDGSLSLTINAQGWSVVASPIQSLPTDRVFRFVALSDDSAKLRFGNGTYGAIPGPYTIFASYAYGGGLVSNIATLNAITSYAGTDSNISGVFNSTAMTGGSDAENIATTKILGPLLLKARDRFVTIQDGIALILANTISAVSQCQINRNTYGALSCQVLGVASGTQAAPGSGARATLAAYLQAKSALSGIDVYFDAGTFTAVTVGSTGVKLLPGYTSGAVFPYLTLAWNLLLTPAGNQIVNDFRGSTSVAAAVADYNAIFSAAFGPADYAQFTTLLNQLINIGVMQFGYLLTQTILDAFVQGYVSGVQYITWGAFTPALPYQAALAEILTPSTPPSWTAL